MLRELLIDDHPVLHQVNRKRQMRLRFSVRDPATFGPHTWWLGINSTERDVPGGASHELGLRDFLAYPMANLGSSTLTIQDLIQLGANVLGGIHLGPAKTAPHVAHEQYPMRIQHGNTPLELVALVPITEVLLRGLNDLREAVQRDLPLLPERGGRVAITGMPP